MSRMTINNLLSVGAGIASGMLQGQTDARQYQEQQRQQKFQQDQQTQQMQMEHARLLASMAQYAGTPEQGSALIGQAGTLAGAPAGMSWAMPDPANQEATSYALKQWRQRREQADPSQWPTIDAGIAALQKGLSTKQPLGKITATIPGQTGGLPLPGGAGINVTLPPKQVPLGPAGLGGLPPAVDAKGLGAKASAMEKELGAALDGGMVAPQHRPRVEKLRAGFLRVVTPSTPQDEAQIQNLLNEVAKAHEEGAFVEDPNKAAMRDYHTDSAAERIRRDTETQNTRYLQRINEAKGNPARFLDAVRQQRVYASKNDLEPYGGAAYDETPQDVATSTSTPGAVIGTPVPGARPDSSELPSLGPPTTTEGTRKETPEEVAARLHAAAAASTEDPKARQGILRSGLGQLMNVFRGTRWQTLSEPEQDSIVQQIAEYARDLNIPNPVPAGVRGKLLTPYQQGVLDLRSRGLDLGESRFAETQYENQDRNAQADRRLDQADTRNAQGQQRIDRVNGALTTQLKTAATQARQDWLNFLKRPDVAANDPAFKRDEAGKRIPTNQPGWTNFPKPWDNPAGFRKAGEAIRSGADPNPLHAEAWSILNRAGKAQQAYEKAVQGNDSAPAATVKPAATTPTPADAKQRRVSALDAYRAKHGEPTARQRNMIFRAADQGLIQ
jgi:hypothetical protein